jgi:hypothetical protein
MRSQIAQTSKPARSDLCTQILRVWEVIAFLCYFNKQKNTPISKSFLDMRFYRSIGFANHHPESFGMARRAINANRSDMAQRVRHQSGDVLCTAFCERRRHINSNPGAEFFIIG